MIFQIAQSNDVINHVLGGGNNELICSVYYLSLREKMEESCNNPLFSEKEFFFLCKDRYEASKNIIEVD